MSYEQVQAVIGTAIIDSEFRRRLLNSPARAVEEFDLTVDERSAIAGIRAQSLEDFARQLHCWLTQTPAERLRRGREAAARTLRLAV